MFLCCRVIVEGQISNMYHFSNICLFNECFVIGQLFRILFKAKQIRIIILTHKHCTYYTIQDIEIVGGASDISEVGRILASNN